MLVKDYEMKLVIESKYNIILCDMSPLTCFKYGTSLLMRANYEVGEKTDTVPCVVILPVDKVAWGKGQIVHL